MTLLQGSCLRLCFAWALLSGCSGDDTSAARDSGTPPVDTGPRADAPAPPDTGSTGDDAGVDSGVVTLPDGGTCPEGTCTIRPDSTMCEPPTGPTGNACCECSADGRSCADPCRCASPDTPIATPDGERAIASLEVGDLVYTVDRGALVARPIARINRTPVRNHRVVRATLESGVTLEISAGHPTADGRTFGDLRAGAVLGGVGVTNVAVVPYTHPFTYDILPASDTGTYVAGGALIGSTLAPEPNEP